MVKAGAPGKLPGEPFMAATTVHDRSDYDDGMGAGRATLGGIGLFTSLGIGLMFLGFLAAFGLRGVTTVQADDMVSGVTVLLVGLFPFFAAPILSLLAGAWCGTRTGGGGTGALAGAGSALLGTIVMFLLVAIGFVLGAAAAGVDTAAVQFPENVAVPPGIASTLGYLASVSGVVYLLANIIIGAVAGSIAGALVHHGGYVQRREVARRPVRI